jgi:hypothetical protein
MLAGHTPLEDFVDVVAAASGMERWALWMEMSGRMQMSLAASRNATLHAAVPPAARTAERPSSARRGAALPPRADEESRRVARAIMRRAPLQVPLTFLPLRGKRGAPLRGREDAPQRGKL